jgi:hypothetical protein
MALDALAVGIQTKKVNWLLDADIRGFFDTLSHEWLTLWSASSTNRMPGGSWKALDTFRDRVRRLWHRTLNRRSQKGRSSEPSMSRIAACWLPLPRVCQPYPEVRFAVMIQGKSPVR